MRKSLDLCYRRQLKMCSRRSRSLRRRRRRCLVEDRISTMPDDILLSIMSFLTFKDMIKTSLLSRRWLDLCLHTPVLNLHSHLSDAIEISERQRWSYIKWVNRVLRRHKGLYLEEFRIVCDLDDFYRKSINKWLVFALERKVEHLELNFLLAGRFPYTFNNDYYVFPSRFLNLTCSSQFPHCLKSLSLKSVDVNGEAINFILIDCPFLERLEVVNTDKLVDLVITDSTLVLKHLVIKNCDDLKAVGISNFNLISLEIPCVDDFTLTDVPMLVDLSLTDSSYNLSHSMSRASSCYSKLNVLSLDGYKLKDVTELSNFDQMTKLKRLTIKVGAWGDESLTELISLVSSCPCLEEFVLKLSWMEPERTDRIILSISSSSVKSKTLKVFEFMGYYGRVSDVELIIHVVENAVGLEKIMIDTRYIYHRRGSSRSEREKETRSIALEQFEDLRNSIPQHVHLLIN